MTQEELKHLKGTLMRGGYNKQDILWQRAFVEYTKDTTNALGMGCMSCYRKVYNHLNQKHKPLESIS
jgi:hypothetical protein